MECTCGEESILFDLAITSREYRATYRRLQKNKELFMGGTYVFCKSFVTMLRWKKIVFQKFWSKRFDRYSNLYDRREKKMDGKISSL